MSSGPDREPGWLGRQFFGVGADDPWVRLTPEKKRRAARLTWILAACLFTAPFAAIAIAWTATSVGHVRHGVAFAALFVGWVGATLSAIEARRMSRDL